MVAMLRGWGLDALAPDVLKFLQQGYTQDQVSVLLQDTQAYKQRFAGNEIRKQKGLPVLSPVDYLNTEAAYRQILASNGMPIGFYDQPSDFASWIGTDVSPSEISNRVSLAVDAANKLDDGTKKAFQDFYGIGKNDLAAFFLDQQRALPALQKIASGARIAGLYNDAGLSLSKDRAEQLGGMAQGQNVDQLTNAAIDAAFSGQRLTNIYSGVPGYTQADAEAEIFGNNPAARKKRMDLAGLEAANFAGASGVGNATLAKSTNY